ncbi:MAG: hemoglobin [Paracoccaceae bacterium]|jgi:hemoglobin
MQYGVEDGSYKAAGELPGITKLVDAFYDFMEVLP